MSATAVPYSSFRDLDEPLRSRSLYSALVKVEDIQARLNRAKSPKGTLSRHHTSTHRRRGTANLVIGMQFSANVCELTHSEISPKPKERLMMIAWWR